MEDVLLVQVVGKYCTSDVLGLDWTEVASKLPGRSKHQWKEGYRFVDTVVELTFVFISVIFLGSPDFRSSFVFTKVTDSVDSTRPIQQMLHTSAKLTYLSVYDNRDDVFDPSSFTHVHSCISSRNPTRQTLSTSVKLTSLSMYDIRNGETQCM